MSPSGNKRASASQAHLDGQLTALGDPTHLMAMFSRLMARAVVSTLRHPATTPIMNVFLRRSLTVASIAVFPVLFSAAYRAPGRTAGDERRVRRSDRATTTALHHLAADSLASPAAPGSAEPFLSVGANGKVYMSWLEPASPGYSLRFAVLQGRTWSAPRTIATREDFFVNWADFPSIKVLDGNRLAAHWLQRNGKGTYAYGVRIALSENGGESWGEAISPHRDSSQTEHGFVTLWNERGTLGAAWLDGRNTAPGGHDAAHSTTGGMMLMSTTLSPGGKLSAEAQLDVRTCDCCQNAAAITSAGPIVAYRDRSPNEIRDIYVTRRVAGKWVVGTPVHNDDWKIAACPVNGPAIAAAGNRVALAWFAAPGDSARVQVAFSNNAGEKFEAPIRVDGGQPAGRVDVALLPDGGALVTWVERVGGDTAAVRARRISRSGVAGITTTVATSSTARTSGFPRAVIAGSDVVFAWTLPGKPSTVRVARAPLTDFK